MIYAVVVLAVLNIATISVLVLHHKRLNSLAEINNILMEDFIKRRIDDMPELQKAFQGIANGISKAFGGMNNGSEE